MVFMPAGHAPEHLVVAVFPAGVSARMAALRSVLRGNPHHHAASTLSLAAQDVEECTPPDIGDGAGEVGLHHVADLEVFVSNQVVFVDQLPGGLVVEVLP